MKPKTKSVQQRAQDFAAKSHKDGYRLPDTAAEVRLMIKIGYVNGFMAGRSAAIRKAKP